MALSFGLLAASQAKATELPPLSSEEMAAVIQEVKVMVNTYGEAVERFVVRDATPSRIDRLFNMPELLQQPFEIRQNALVFAGHSSLLSFTKPSDVLYKISNWFPQELAAARVLRSYRDTHSLRYYLDLLGPYDRWNDESIAFMEMWDCMPQIAWLKPQENPFMRRLGDGGNAMMPVMARSSAIEEFDFNYCILNNRRYMSKRLSESVIPILRNKFAHFLSSNRCRGVGPDDCVLILHMWASLLPDDVELARTIRELEPEIALDAPLPELLKPKDQYHFIRQIDGEPRFDVLLRRAAFLRTKLISVLSAPTAWTEQALPAVLHQLTLFQRQGNIGPGREIFDLSQNAHIDPWRVAALNAVKSKRMQDAIFAELNSMEEDSTCKTYARWLPAESWLDFSEGFMRSTYALQRMEAKRPLNCFAPDWQYLLEGKTEVAQGLRERYLALLGKEELHETILGNLTGNGERCFGGKDSAAQDWLRKTCNKWISEPQTVTNTLPNSKLKLTAKNRFSSVNAVIGTRDKPTGGWIVPPTHQGVVASMAKYIPNAIKAFDAVLTEIEEDRGLPYTVQVFQQTQSGKKLLVLSGIESVGAGRSPALKPPYLSNENRVLLVVEGAQIRPLWIPSRFAYQYDEGNIYAVSDLDQDGNLEVWFNGTWGECDGEDSKPGVNCSISTTYMGEEFGGGLSWFVRGAMPLAEAEVQQ